MVASANDAKLDPHADDALNVGLWPMPRIARELGCSSEKALAWLQDRNVAVFDLNRRDGERVKDKARYSARAADVLAELERCQIAGEKLQLVDRRADHQHEQRQGPGYVSKHFTAGGSAINASRDRRKPPSRRAAAPRPGDAPPTVAGSAPPAPGEGGPSSSHS